MSQCKEVRLLWFTHVGYLVSYGTRWQHRACPPRERWPIRPFPSTLLTPNLSSCWLPPLKREALKVVGEPIKYPPTRSSFVPCFINSPHNQETEAALNNSLIENYNVMVGLYARLGVAPGVLPRTNHANIFYSSSAAVVLFAVVGVVAKMAVVAAAVTVAANTVNVFIDVFVVHAAAFAAL